MALRSAAICWQPTYGLPVIQDQPRTEQISELPTTRPSDFGPDSTDSTPDAHTYGHLPIPIRGIFNVPVADRRRPNCSAKIRWVTPLISSSAPVPSDREIVIELWTDCLPPKSREESRRRLGPPGANVSHYFALVSIGPF